VFVWSRRDRGRPLQTVELNAPDRQPARAGIACGARYGTLGGGTTETLRNLIAKRVLADVDPVDGIFGLGAF
jgi:hypothetical protein